MSEQNVDNVGRWIGQFNRLRTPEGARAVLGEFWDTDADYYPEAGARWGLGLDSSARRVGRSRG